MDSSAQAILKRETQATLQDADSGDQTRAEDDDLDVLFGKSAPAKKQDEDDEDKLPYTDSDDEDEEDDEDHEDEEDDDEDDEDGTGAKNPDVLF